MNSHNSDVAAWSNLDARVRAEQIRSIYDQLPKSTRRMMVAAAVMVVAMYFGGVSKITLAVWFAIMLGNQAWRFGLYRRYLRAKPPSDQARVWGTRWARGAFISGLIWGSAGIFMFVPDSPGYQAFLVVALIGVTAGALTLIAIHKLSFYAFVLPALIPLTLRLAWEGDTLHFALAAVCVLVLYSVLDFGRNLNRQLEDTLRARFKEEALVKEVTDQKKIAEEARHEAERATQAKSKFLAAVGHDLRQPLNALRLHAGALAKRLHDPDADRKIEQAGFVMNTMLKQAMEVSQLDSGTLHTEISVDRLQPLFERLKANFEPEAAERELRIRFVPTSLAVLSDHDLLGRILQNLIGNALRYTKTGGVVVGARRRGEHVRIEVWDSGPGIPELERKHIFDEFYRGSSAEGTQQLGLGLGLSIVQRFADLLDHRLYLESIPGSGSRFSVECPRAAQPSGVPATIVADNAGVEYAGYVAAVVDDDATVLDEMTEILGSWGFDVIAAQSIEGLLQDLAATDSIPDLLISDYDLAANTTGIDAVTQFRKKYGATLPAIIITGKTDPGLAATIRGSGLDVLYKPVKPAKLRTQIAALI